MSVWELAAALRAVGDALGTTTATTQAAAREVEAARAMIAAAGRVDDGWYPPELDLALAELTRVAEQLTRAREVLADYLAGL